MSFVLRRMPAFHVLALSVLLGSTTVTGSDRPTSIGERLQGAGRVVVARARAVDARWQQNSRGDRVIVSRVLLDVEETLKGSAEKSLWMDLEGGTLDGYTLRISGLPLLTPGERAVFFLDTVAAALHTPHRRGEGILKLDDNDVVRGSTLRLADIRGVAAGASKERGR